MSAQPIEPHRPANPGHDPAAIRSLLPADDQADFERDYRAAIDEAKQSFDMEPLNKLLEQWRRIAVLKQSPGHDEAIELGLRFLAGDDVPVYEIDVDALERGEVTAACRIS